MTFTFEGQPINQPPLKTRPKQPNQNILGPIWGVLGGIDMGFLGPQTVTVVNEYLQYKAPRSWKCHIYGKRSLLLGGGQKTWKKTFKQVHKPTKLSKLNMNSSRSQLVTKQFFIKMVEKRVLWRSNRARNIQSQALLLQVWIFALKIAGLTRQISTTRYTSH